MSGGRMHHYIDIHLRPDPEFPAHQLMSALYGKLHRALAASFSSGMAVSFPGYSLAPLTLGNCLRLVGTAADLDRLLTTDWLRGMADHIILSAVQPVPKDAAHRQLRRVQAKSSPERLQRRQMRRHGLTLAQAMSAVPITAVERLNLPYVSAASASTGQRFRLFLQLGPVLSERLDGTFNAYGLSGTATTPWF
jgi:CRISPR-associated endonuclease Csy4